MRVFTIVTSVVILATTAIARAGDADKDLFRRATELVRSHDYKGAIPLLRELVGSNPFELRYHVNLGFALWSRDELDEAAKELKTALLIDSTDPVANYYLGRIEETQDHFERAISLFESSRKTTPDAGVREAVLYQKLGQHEKSLELLKEAIYRTPWDGAAHYLAAMSLRKLGKEREAQQELASSQHLKKIDQNSTQYLSELSDAAGRHESDRVRVLRSAVLGDPNPAVMLSLGLVLAQAGYDVEAVEPLQRADAALPDSFAASFDLGLALMKTGKSAEAEPPLQHAAALLPDSFDAHRVLGALYASTNRHLEAIAALKRASALQPDHQPVLALLALQYLSAGKADEALNTLVHADPSPAKDELTRRACAELSAKEAKGQGVCSEFASR